MIDSTDLVNPRTLGVSSRSPGARRVPRPATDSRGGEALGEQRESAYAVEQGDDTWRAGRRLRDRRQAWRLTGHTLVMRRWNPLVYGGQSGNACRSFPLAHSRSPAENRPQTVALSALSKGAV
jgi:hypothetical protein